MVHIVLVHGACHGAWCWYKLKPLLEAAGHQVTGLDLTASGIDPRSITDIRTLEDYTQPLTELMASIPAEEKVVLVGHSLGGYNIALAMDMYPQKIRVAVFLTALMPDTTHPPSYVLDKYYEITPAEEMLDTLYIPYIPYGKPEENLTAMLFGPKFTSTKLYQLCSPKDVALANTLLRPSPTLQEDLAKRSPFSTEGYGSVKRVFIVCTEDKTFVETFVRWQIENFGVTQVKEIVNADHMAMLSRPLQLFKILLDITNTF